jgi:hypothetical protein
VLASRFCPPAWLFPNQNHSSSESVYQCIDMYESIIHETHYSIQQGPWKCFHPCIPNLWCNLPGNVRRFHLTNWVAGFPFAILIKPFNPLLGVPSPCCPCCCDKYWVDMYMIMSILIR